MMRYHKHIFVFTFQYPLLNISLYEHYLVNHVVMHVNKIFHNQLGAIFGSSDFNDHLAAHLKGTKNVR